MKSQSSLLGSPEAPVLTPSWNLLLICNQNVEWVCNMWSDEKRRWEIWGWEMEHEGAEVVKNNVLWSLCSEILSISLLVFSFYCLCRWDSFHFREFNILPKGGQMCLIFEVCWSSVMFLPAWCWPRMLKNSSPNPRLHVRLDWKKTLRTACKDEGQEYDGPDLSHEINYISGTCALTDKLLLDFRCFPNHVLSQGDSTFSLLLADLVVWGLEPRFLVFAYVQLLVTWFSGVLGPRLRRSARRRRLSGRSCWRWCSCFPASRPPEWRPHCGSGHRCPHQECSFKESQPEL